LPSLLSKQARARGGDRRRRDTRCQYGASDWIHRRRASRCLASRLRAARSAKMQKREIFRKDYEGRHLARGFGPTAAKNRFFEGR